MIRSQKMIILDLSSDLKRIALGYERGSVQMAERFTQEALKRKQELNMNVLSDYIIPIMEQIEVLLTKEKTDRTAEDALMYSVLLQNYGMYKFVEHEKRLTRLERKVA